MAALSFSSNNYIVNENAGVVTVTLNYDGSIPTTTPPTLPGAPIVVTLSTTNGSANAGTNFSSVPSPGTVSFTAGVPQSFNFNVPVIDDGVVKPTLTFSVNASNPATGVSTSAVSILNTDTTTTPTGAVTFSQPSYVVNENAGFVTVTLVYNGSVPLSNVVISTVPGSATAATNYTTSTVTTNFAAGNVTPQSFSFNVPILNDGIINPTLTFSIKETDTLTGGSSAVVSIIDANGPGTANGGIGTIQFSQPTYSVGEDGGYVDLIVNRVGGSTGPLIFTYKVNQGTGASAAIQGVDYLFPVGAGDGQGTDTTSPIRPFVFSDGDTTPKTIRIPILNNRAPSPTKTLAVDLVQNVGISGGTFVAQTATVNILDNGATALTQFGTVGFGDLTSINVQENAGSVTIPILVSGAVNAGDTVTITYSTKFGDATKISTAAQPNVNFIPVTGTAGVTKTTSLRTIPITIPIIDETNVDPTLSFTLSIDSVDGAPTNGSQSVQINILDNDGINGVPVVDPTSNPTFFPSTNIPQNGNNIINGTDANDTLYGAQGNDTISGFGGNDTIYGGQGDDILFGNQGNDFLYGNKGNDTLYGGQGDDIIYAGQGNDLVFGGQGNDLIFGNRGINTLTGGQGNDTLVIHPNDNSGYDYISDFQIGTDVIGLTSGIQFNQLAIVQSGSNTVIKFAPTNQDLTILGNVNAGSINSSSFINI